MGCYEPRPVWTYVHQVLEYSTEVISKHPTKSSPPFAPVRPGSHRVSCLPGVVQEHTHEAAHGHAQQRRYGEHLLRCASARCGGPPKPFTAHVQEVPAAALAEDGAEQPHTFSRVPPLLLQLDDFMLGGHPDKLEATIVTQKGHENARIKVLVPRVSCSRICEHAPAGGGGKPNRLTVARWRAA